MRYVCVCVLERNSARAPVPATARTQPQMGGGVDPVSAREQAESARTCVCVCVKTQQRTLTGPDHRQDTTANGRRGVDLSVQKLNNNNNIIPNLQLDYYQGGPGQYARRGQGPTP